MVENVDHSNLHRTAKYFMDSGRVDTYEDALGLLARFGLTIAVGPEVKVSRQHQIALLTLVNLARRTFLGGVEIVGELDASLLVSFCSCSDLHRAVTHFHGSAVETARPEWPLVQIGTCNQQAHGANSWQLTWSGWRGGVVPSKKEFRLDENDANALAPAIAAAICAAEVFADQAKDHSMAGLRPAGMSLWQPGADWLLADTSEPKLAFLPSRLWIVGLGNLGQAFAWLLACFPYEDCSKVELVLQDHDRLAVSNVSTSLLTSTAMIGRKKTRAVGQWLERIGFSVTLEERLFGDWIRRGAQDPSVVFCGVDNSLARASLGKSGFDLIVEAGLGAGPDGFRNFAVHTFPSSRTPEQIWSREAQTSNQDVLCMPAYTALKKTGIDACGLVELASRTVGVPFVGLTAASIAMGELLRRLHGGRGFERVSGSLLSVDDVESLSVEGAAPYAHGHVMTTPSSNTID